MEEVKIKQEQNKEVEKPKEEKKKSLVEQVKELQDFKKQQQNGNIKTKKVRIPRKLKANKRKIRKGWIGVMIVQENGNVRMEKQKVDGFAYKDSEGNYHTTDGREVLFWLGKFPFIIQPSWMNNPVNVKDRVTKITDKLGNIKYVANETYGDKYKMAKMLKDTIKVKGSGEGAGKLIFIIIALVIGGIALNYAMGGKFF